MPVSSAATREANPDLMQVTVRDVGIYIDDVLNRSKTQFKFNDVYRYVHFTDPARRCVFALRNCGSVDLVLEMLQNCITKFSNKYLEILPEKCIDEILAVIQPVLDDFPDSAKKIANHLSYLNKAIRDQPFNGQGTLLKIMYLMFSNSFFPEFLDPAVREDNDIYLAITTELENSLAAEVQNPDSVLSVINFFYILRDEINSPCLNHLFGCFLSKAEKYYTSWAHNNCDLEATKFYEGVRIFNEKKKLFKNEENARHDDTLFQCTVKDFGERILGRASNGYDVLAGRDNWLAMKRIYLCSKVNRIAIEVLIAVFSGYIDKQFKELLAMPEIISPLEWIGKVLKSFLYLKDMIRECYENDKLFNQRLGNEMNILFRESVGAPISLVMYMDSLIRQESFRTDSAEMKLAVELFKFMGSKDVFTKVYVNPHMIHRLLEHKSTPETESAVSSMFSDEGPNIVDPMKQAIADFKSAQDAIRRISDTDAQFKCMKVTMDRSIVFNHLTLPVDPTMQTVKPPPELKAISESFTKAYQNTYQQKNLSWDWKEGSIELNITIDATTIRLECTTLQAIFLFHLNNHGAMTTLQLFAASGIAERLGKPHLLPMLAKRLLIGPPQKRGEPFNMEKHISINPSFRTPNVRLQLTAVSRAFKISNAMDQSIAIMRKNQLDACVVRYMKTHATGNFNDIFIHSSSYLRQHFTLSRPLLEQTISYLLQDSYIEESSPEVYKYIS